MSRPVLVTGASGFIGGHLLAELRARGLTIVEARRELGPDTQWRDVLEGVGCVVHLAAAAHERAQAHERRGDFEALKRVNALATERLARAAADAGVATFVFLSTIGVHGDETFGAPFNEESARRPRSLYAASKLHAEQLLAGIGKDGGMAVCILRPTLVYGPGNRGNFIRLLRAVDRGWPLPFAAVRNRRSLTYVGNLVSAIGKVLESPKAAGAFVVCDAEALSTPQIVRGLAAGLGRHARLFAFPQAMLRLAGAAAGRRDLARRLVGSLEADGAKLRRVLEWQPPFSAAQALAQTAQWFASRRR